MRPKMTPKFCDIMMVMTTLQSQLPFEMLLHSLQQLSMDELNQVGQQVNLLKARHKFPYLSQIEAQLLRQIEAISIPLPTQQRCKMLSDKSRSGNITSDEQEELMNLVDEIEQANAQRLNLLAQLAQLRQLSLSKLIQLLGIQPFTYE